MDLYAYSVKKRYLVQCLHRLADYTHNNLSLVM